MYEASFEETLEQILASHPQYPRDAYLFVREALDHTQKSVAKGGRVKRQHVTGQELLAGIREHAIQQFGPMTVTVFEEWNIRACRDFGEIVFNMVEVGMLGKTEQDSRTDFEDGYDFDDAFRKPFLPPSKLAAQRRETNPTQA